MYSCICVCMCVEMFVCDHMCVYAYVYVYRYVCLCDHMWVYIFTYICVCVRIYRHGDALEELTITVARQEAGTEGRALEECTCACAEQSEYRREETNQSERQIGRVREQDPQTCCVRARGYNSHMHAFAEENSRQEISRILEVRMWHSSTTSAFANTFTNARMRDRLRILHMNEYIRICIASIHVRM